MRAPPSRRMFSVRSSGEKPEVTVQPVADLIPVEQHRLQPLASKRLPLEALARSSVLPDSRQSR